MFPEVALDSITPAPSPERTGFTIFFTGLPSSGKSTIASALQAVLAKRNGRPVTLLDGDIVRTHLSSELGFSKAHRDLNVCRIAFVAAEITKHGGIVICAAIAPYAAARTTARAMIGQHGGFVLIHAATPLEVCEARDPKGLYAQAREGIVPHFTGVSDPYEAPTDAEITVDAKHDTPDQAVTQIVTWLEKAGLLLPDCPSPTGTALR